MKLRSGIAAGLCLACCVFGDHTERDESMADLELMILQDATLSFDRFIEQSHTFIPNFLSELRHKPRSLTTSMALFGDKPCPSTYLHGCFETVFSRTRDLSKCNNDEFRQAISELGHTRAKWHGGDMPDDCASAIIHSSIQGDFFSKKVENDGIVRIVIVITDAFCKVNNDRDVGLESLRTAIPCKSSDYDGNNYPSDHDVTQALKVSGVTPLIILTDSYASHWWNDSLKAWGISEKNLFPMVSNESHMDSNESHIENFFTQALRTVTYRIIHDETTTTTTAPTTTSTTSPTTTTSPTAPTTTTSPTAPTTTTSPTAPTTTTSTTGSTTTTSPTAPTTTTTTTAPTTSTSPTTRTTASTGTTKKTVVPVSTTKASSNQKGKIIGAMAGASAGAMLLGSAAYFGVQTMTAAPQAANYNMPDIEQQHNGRPVHQGHRESITIPDETFFQ